MFNFSFLYSLFCQLIHLHHNLLTPTDANKLFQNKHMKYIKVVTQSYFISWKTHFVILQEVHFTNMIRAWTLGTINKFSYIFFLFNIFHSSIQSNHIFFYKIRKLKWSFRDVFLTRQTVFLRDDMIIQSKKNLLHFTHIKGICSGYFISVCIF